MTEPIEAEYFNWLCAKVILPYSNQYYDLMKILYKTEFVWVIPGDRNRKDDGLELRQYFLNETGSDSNPIWLNDLCSVLEVLISFAQRASFQTDTPVYHWFWIFMENIGLSEYRQVSESDIPEIEEILYNFIWRTYKPDGYGGLFPLDNAQEDQRQVEIWYQFCAWVDEKALI